MNEPLTIRIFGRRRNLLVDRPYQHRLSLVTTLLAMLPPALFFGIYSLISAEGSRQIVEASPALEEMVRVQNRTESLLVLAAVLLYGLGVYLVTLLESHRTAGFVFRVNRQLKELAAGRLHGRIVPRRDDHFTYLADSVNRLGGQLRRRSEEDLAALDALQRAVAETAAGLGPGSGRARERLEDIRGRLEALRRMKACEIEPETGHAATLPSIRDDAAADEAGLPEDPAALIR